MMNDSGMLIGIGVGPGDPDLLTFKAIQALRSAQVIAFFAKRGTRGNAREICAKWIEGECLELPFHYPVTVEAHFASDEYRDALSEFYATTTQALTTQLRQGRNVALLAEGDPLFYGSFMHVYVRLRERFHTQIIPGITGMSGCWSAAGEPITWGDDVLTVLPATLPEDDLLARLAATDAAVIMKVGRNFEKVRSAIARAGLLNQAIYVERGTMSNQSIVRLTEKREGTVPYFSLILIPGNGRRPQ